MLPVSQRGGWRQGPVSSGGGLHGDRCAAVDGHSDGAEVRDTGGDGGVHSADDRRGRVTRFRSVGWCGDRESRGRCVDEEVRGPCFGGATGVDGPGNRKVLTVGQFWRDQGPATGGVGWHRDLWATA